MSSSFFLAGLNSIGVVGDLKGLWLRVAGRLELMKVA